MFKINPSDKRKLPILSSPDDILLTSGCCCPLETPAALALALACACACAYAEPDPNFCPTRYRTPKSATGSRNQSKSGPGSPKNSKGPKGSLAVQSMVWLLTGPAVCDLEMPKSNIAVGLSIIYVLGFHGSATAMYVKNPPVPGWHSTAKRPLSLTEPEPEKFFSVRSTKNDFWGSANFLKCGTMSVAKSSDISIVPSHILYRTPLAVVGVSGSTQCESLKAPAVFSPSIPSIPSVSYRGLSSGRNLWREFVW